MPREALVLAPVVTSGVKVSAGTEVTAVVSGVPPVPFGVTWTTIRLPGGGWKGAVVADSAPVPETTAGDEAGSARAAPAAARISATAMLSSPGVSVGSVAPRVTGVPDVVVPVERKVP